MFVHKIVGYSWYQVLSGGYVISGPMLFLGARVSLVPCPFWGGGKVSEGSVCRGIGYRGVGYQG